MNFRNLPRRPLCAELLERCGDTHGQKNISCVSNNMSSGGATPRYGPDLHRGMKKYIRDIIDDLNKPGNKDFVPVLPQAPTGGKTVYLDPPKLEPDPQDLDNQDLSADPQQRVEQLDYQAQQNEERETLG
jgi:hypothetical protein